MILAERVTKRFGRNTAVREASLTLGAGESVALWGANGAGKTTLIRCVLGLIRFRGRITIGGHDVLRRGKAARLLIGYVPQEIGFHDELGVREAVRHFSRLKGLAPRGAEEALDRVGLSDHASKRVRELSGGMKQRLALAIALLGDPPVLVLDEVTASLDAVGRGEFVALLKRLSGAGRTMLFASHRIDEIGVLAERVAALDKGRLTSVMPCREFLAGLGAGEVLHLALPAPLRERARSALMGAGFDARLNGVGLLVPVTTGRKAAPFRVLAEANIPVDDFEVVGVAARAEEHT
ncbi:MAG TPA: ABC transporter ATP-binding protein [Phycisphaerales bacterium]|nr:ABC transporter ATP-binding protein [Phycisphaerales bacterium]